MSLAAHTLADLVERQAGRRPRTPARTGSSCRHGFPSTIVSPSLLDDGTPFPNLAWLTCPFLAEQVARFESDGETTRFAARAASEDGLAEALRRTDHEVRRLRKLESGGDDACASVGLAGQRDPLGVKCLHAHVALALLGIDDPIGNELLRQTGTACEDARCERYAEEVGWDAGA